MAGLCHFVVPGFPAAINRKVHRAKQAHHSVGPSLFFVDLRTTRSDTQAFVRCGTFVIAPAQLISLITALLCPLPPGRFATLIALPLKCQARSLRRRFRSASAMRRWSENEQLVLLVGMAVALFALILWRMFLLPH
jgi:hypothetical protein